MRPWPIHKTAIETRNATRVPTQRMNPMKRKERAWEDGEAADTNSHHTIEKTEHPHAEEGKVSRLTKIISGGQTGADRAGLEAAIELGLATGGNATHGFMTTDGPDPTLGTRFGLTEMASRPSLPQMYVMRSKKNVDDADATVAFRFHSSAGTDNTIAYCHSGNWVPLSSLPKRLSRPPHRPVFVVSSLSERDREKMMEEFRKFLIERDVSVLNVAGHRACPKLPRIEEEVKSFLVEALSPILPERRDQVDI